MNNNTMIGVVVLVVVAGALWWLFSSEDKGWDSEYAKQWRQISIDGCMNGDGEISGLLSEGYEYNEALSICTCMVDKAKMYDSPDEADAAAENMSDAEMVEIIKDCF